MDRRAKKLEKKRKDREQAKKKAAVAAARRPSDLELLARGAARHEFGPCFISVGWNDTDAPDLVSVIVTRRLPSGHLVPGAALVDRTCLGVKDGFAQPGMTKHELERLVDSFGAMHGGMLDCEPLLAQSVVFHAIDYARTLGFEPHPDFQAALFGPRPPELLDTPWRAPERPLYVSGPNDNVAAILGRLASAVGPDGFDYDAGGEREEEDDASDGGELIHSPLECTVTRDDTTLRVLIYRGRSDQGWLLEIEDHLGGSTTWDGEFETDQAAQDAALLAIEQDGIESFVVREAEQPALALAHRT